MAATTYLTSMARCRRVRRPNPAQVITTGTWVTVAEWRVDVPGTDNNWAARLSVDAEPDPGVTGQVRLRTSLGDLSAPLNISGSARRLKTAWTTLPLAATRVFLDVRKSAGSGGVRVIRATGLAVSIPPGYTPPGGGGIAPPAPTLPQVVSGGALVENSNQTLHTINSASLSPAPVIGSKVLLIAASVGPSEPPAPAAFVMPGVLVAAGPSTGFNPAFRVTAVDYTAVGQTWTVTSTRFSQVAALEVRNAASFVAGTPSHGPSPRDPGGIAHSERSLGLLIHIMNFTEASVTAPPADHTTVLSPPLTVRQIYAAQRTLATAGTYDPAAPTTGPGVSASSAIAIVAQPSTGGGTGTTAPVVPPFATAGVVTLPLNGDIAALVAAQPAGTNFQLLDGTYTNWEDVRPQTGMYFRGPVSGEAFLDGTGKGYCFRAANAVGGSDNVTISRNIRIAGYGLGTTRSEFGAIQAQPTDVIANVYTYGVANNWFIHDVELHGNSSNGIRISDNCTVFGCVVWGHSVTGIGGDRNVGGIIHANTVDANGFNPATGVASNGANIKLTWINADEGYTLVVPLPSRRPKTTMRITDNTLNATRVGVTGTANTGIWLDLDCKLVEISGNTTNNHPWCGIVLEGCNNNTVAGNTINNSDGYGNALNQNFVLGGITIAESTNTLVQGNTLNGCVRALINRVSNRTVDWYNANNGGNVNYAWPTSQGGTRYWLTDIGPLPVPSATARANMWTGANTYSGNVLVNCDRVFINEGTNGNGQTTQGSTPVATIRFVGNNYTGSPNLTGALSGGGFFDRSNTPVTLAVWRSIPLDRDQP